MQPEAHTGFPGAHPLHALTWASVVLDLLLLPSSSRKSPWGGGHTRASSWWRDCACPEGVLWLLVLCPLRPYKPLLPRCLPKAEPQASCTPGAPSSCSHSRPSPARPALGMWWPRESWWSQHGGLGPSSFRRNWCRPANLSCAGVGRGLWLQAEPPPLGAGTPVGSCGTMPPMTNGDSLLCRRQDKHSLVLEAPVPLEKGTWCLCTEPQPGFGGCSPWGFTAKWCMYPWTSPCNAGLVHY